MMYLLSQGQVSAIDREKTFWGYNKVGDVDPNSQVCTAYEDVPACLDLDYDPGGSIAGLKQLRALGLGLAKVGLLIQRRQAKQLR